MDGAIPPTSLPGGVVTKPIPVKRTSEEINETKKQRQLADLTLMPGWDHFAKHYRARAEHVRVMTGISFDNKTDAEIGQLTRSHRLTADMMIMELTHVENLARSIKDLNARIIPTEDTE